MIKYVIQISKKDVDSAKEEVKEIIRRKKEIVKPVLMLIFPDAMGLFLFCGWYLSLSLSLISFNMYMDEARSEKIQKARKTLNVYILIKKLLEKIRAAKRKPFFVHCFTLSNFKYSLNVFIYLDFSLIEIFIT